MASTMEAIERGLRNNLRDAGEAVMTSVRTFHLAAILDDRATLLARLEESEICWTTWNDEDTRKAAEINSLRATRDSLAELLGKAAEALTETLAVATRNEEGHFADRARAVLTELRAALAAHKPTEGDTQTGLLLTGETEGERR